MFDSPIAAACFVSFMAGLIGRDLLKLGIQRYWQWRMDRDFRLAQERMHGCRHERVVIVDIGMGPVTSKCADCWALHDFVADYPGGPPTGKWYANSARPPKDALTLPTL